MSLRKNLIGSPLTLAVAGVVLRLYRWIAFGGFLLRPDARLLAFLRSREPAVFACWHQDFPQTLGYLSRFSPRRRTYVLASASRDGGLAAACALAIGYREVARGSSASGGAGALLHLSRMGRARPGSFAVVADGPRPPARVLKPGAIHLAQRARLPLWLLRTSWSPDASLARTWARFHAPPPVCRGVFLADGPIEVPADLERAAFESLRVEIERRMNVLAAEADALAARRS